MDIVMANPSVLSKVPSVFVLIVLVCSDKHKSASVSYGNRRYRLKFAI